MFRIVERAVKSTDCTLSLDVDALVDAFVEKAGLSAVMIRSRVTGQDRT